jgi:type I phosphodiesterase/nucleotide pyrophosphatase
MQQTPNSLNEVAPATRACHAIVSGTRRCADLQTIDTLRDAPTHARIRATQPLFVPHRRLVVIFCVGISLTWSCSAPRSGEVASIAPGPDHLLLLVFDQMRPDYIDRFDLRNFKSLRASSRHYPEAYVGHLGSQTVVSHLVIPTGLLPKALPWQDDVVLDRAGSLGKAGAAYETARLTREQFWKLLASIAPSQFVGSRIREKHRGKIIAIGEKDYATLMLGTPIADAIVTLARLSGECRPAGVNVPEYIAADPRFTLDCRETYGTHLSTIYELDGNHYVPGNDRAHLGGDVWTTDAAVAVMDREEWSGLFLTFGGIDKVAHMLGEQDGAGLQSVPSAYRLADVAKIADDQLGRLLEALKRRNLLDRTLIVVTADHGGQQNRFYLGNNKYQSCCPLENSESRVEPPYWIEHLLQIGKLQTSYQDTSLKIWLADVSEGNEKRVISGMADISGMTEVYALRASNGSWRYERVFSRLEQQTPRYRAWAASHSAELMDTMASDGAPNLVGLLADGFGFGRIGDHGGAQEMVQRIPLMIRVPGETGTVRPEPLRIADIEAQITKLMQLDPGPGDTR